jgi:hypothetical protein
MDAMLVFGRWLPASTVRPAVGCNPARLCHELTEVAERNLWERKATQNAKDAPELQATFSSRGTIDVP